MVVITMWIMVVMVVMITMRITVVMMQAVPSAQVHRRMDQLPHLVRLRQRNLLQLFVCDQGAHAAHAVVHGAHACTQPPLLLHHLPRPWRRGMHWPVGVCIGQEVLRQRGKARCTNIKDGQGGVLGTRCSIRAHVCRCVCARMLVLPFSGQHRTTNDQGAADRWGWSTNGASSLLTCSHPAAACTERK